MTEPGQTDLTRIRGSTLSAFFPILLGLLGLACIGIGLWTWRYGHTMIFPLSQEKKDIAESLGNYGSYLQGTVGSLFSLAGFFVISAALLAQVRQLRQQEESSEQQDAQFREQQKALRKQLFEGSFFRLLEIHHSLVQGLKLEVTGATFMTEKYLEGKDSLASIWAGFKDRFGAYTDRTSVEVIRKEAVAYYELYQNDLGYYFRTLYHLFKFIHDSDFKPEEKRRYSSLARAQLSTSELLLLFYNCFRSVGEGFKPLIEEFGLFEHLDKAQLLDPSNKSFYKDSAYE